VATVLFGAAADEAMTALEADPGRAHLLERVDAALQALAANPEDRRCRRRSYVAGVPGLWGMPVRSQDDDWLILWLNGPAEAEITVIYVGPDL
jgi:hypothetical protein